MSTTLAAPAATGGPGPGRAPQRVMAWAVAASLLLAGSGVLRAFQTARHQEEQDSKVQSPFPLSTLPRTVGDWRVVEGGETRLDDQTTRITGSTDHVLWKYKDDQNGTTVSALILYGPAEPVVPHTPQVCYPATGYHDASGVIDRPIQIGDGKVASFRANAFVKAGGRDLIRSIVYHSFRLDGTWSPGIANLRFPRKNPGIFKVQVQRNAIDGEQVGSDGEPVEQFLEAFLSALERQIAASTPNQVAR